VNYDVCVVGGVAGLTASTFVARAGLATVVVDDGHSILRRNAHLENFPGFPRGVDARRLLERTRRQAERAGVTFVDGRVTDVARGESDADVTDPADAPDAADAAKEADAAAREANAAYAVPLDEEPVMHPSVGEKD